MISAAAWAWRRGGGHLCWLSAAADADADGDFNQLAASGKSAAVNGVKRSAGTKLAEDHFIAMRLAAVNNSGLEEHVPFRGQAHPDAQQHADAEQNGGI